MFWVISCDVVICTFCMGPDFLWDNKDYLRSVCLGQQLVLGAIRPGFGPGPVLDLGQTQCRVSVVLGPCVTLRDLQWSNGPERIRLVEPEMAADSLEDFAGHAVSGRHISLPAWSDKLTRNLPEFKTHWLHYCLIIDHTKRFGSREDWSFF